MMDNTEPNPADVLEPCPFCGSKAFMWPDFGNGVQINCNKPCAVSPTVGMRTEAQAISAWNLRQQAQPTPDAMLLLAEVFADHGKVNSLDWTDRVGAILAALEDKHA